MFSKAFLTFSAHARARGTLLFQNISSNLTKVVNVFLIYSDLLYLKIEGENASFSILNSLTLECFAQICNFRDVFLILKLG